MSSCAIPSCRNNRKKNKKGVRFYSFPKNPTFNKLCKEACRLGADVIIKNQVICSEHFERTSFSEKPRIQCYFNYSPKGGKGSRKLKEEAIPSLKLSKKIILKKDVARASPFLGRPDEPEDADEEGASPIKIVKGTTDNEHCYTRLEKRGEDTNAETDAILDYNEDIIDIERTEISPEKGINFDESKREKISSAERSVRRELLKLKDGIAPDSDHNCSELIAEKNNADIFCLENVHVDIPRQMKCSAVGDENFFNNPAWENTDLDLGVAPLEQLGENVMNDGEKNYLCSSAPDFDKCLRRTSKHSDTDIQTVSLMNLTAENCRLKEAEMEARLLLEQNKVGLEITEYKVEKLTKELEAKNKEILRLQIENGSMRQTMEKFFSKTQLDRLVRNKNSKWEPEDIAHAISIRCISPKAYRFFRDSEGWPLPCLSTLRYWSGKLDLKPGINKALFILMNGWGSDLSEINKLTVISFDETYLSDKVSFDKASEKIMGPYKAVQVIMARSLTSNWKQPIFYEYDFTITKEVYMEVVKNLYVGFIVVATVSDMGPGNRGLHTDLGVNVHNTDIQHPSNEEFRIFFLADVPHLLKLIRNHFIDKGFLLPNGKFISKRGLEELLEVSSTSDLKPSFKLTKAMLDLQGSERMRVLPAARMFSKNLSNAVKLAGSEGTIKYQNYEELSKFLLLVNNWFDVHNSVNKYGAHEGLNAYCGSEKQIAILDEMSELIAKLKIGNHQSATSFQNGMIISNESLKNLFKYLQKNYDFEYIITRRLNQDVLENFFSFIRSMGSNYTHPDPLQFHYRLRLYLLCKHSGTVFASKTNCEQSKEEEITITSDVLNRTFQEEPLTVQDISDESIMTLDLPENCLVDWALLENFEEQEKAGSATRDEGLAHLAGYVAFRLRDKFPELGKATRDITNEEESKGFHNSTWISINSTGGLRQPCTDLYIAASAVEDVFLDVHGKKGFNRSGNVLSSVVEKVLKTRPESLKVPREAIQLLVRTRTFFRIRRFNDEKNEGKREMKRKKKLEKFTNIKSEATSTASKLNKLNDKVLQNSDTKQKEMVVEKSSAGNASSENPKLQRITNIKSEATSTASDLNKLNDKVLQNSDPKQKEMVVEKSSAGNASSENPKLQRKRKSSKAHDPMEIKKSRKCSLCKNVGHTKRTCPTNHT